MDLLNKRFEDALAQDVKFIDAKKLFSELRFIQNRIDELHKNNSNTQYYFPWVIEPKKNCKDKNDCNQAIADFSSSLNPSVSISGFAVRV